jgi:hypothetical protein
MPTESRDFEFRTTDGSYDLWLNRVAVIGEIKKKARSRIEVAKEMFVAK